MNKMQFKQTPANNPQANQKNESNQANQASNEGTSAVSDQTSQTQQNPTASSDVDFNSIKSDINSINSSLSISKQTLQNKDIEISTLNSTLTLTREKLVELNALIKNNIQDKRRIQNELFKINDQSAKEDEQLFLLKNNHESMIERKTTLLSKISDLQDSDQVLSEKLQTQKTVLAKQKRDFVKFSKLVTDLSDKLNSNMKSRAAHLTQIQTLTSKINEFNKKLNDIFTKVDHSESDTKAINTQVANLRTTRNGLLSNINNESQKSNQLQSQIQSIQNSENEKQKNLNKLALQKTQLLTRLQFATDKSSDIDADISKANNSINSIKNKITDKQTQETKLDQNIGDLTSQVQGVKQDSQALLALLNAQSTNSKSDTVVSLNNEILSLQSNLNQQSSDNNSINKLVLDLTKTKLDLSDKVDKNNQTLSKLEADIDN